MTTTKCPTCGATLGRDWRGRPRRCAHCEPSGAGPTARQPLIRSSLLPNLLAALSCFAFYAIGPFLLLRDTYWYHLFCGHGWVPYALAYLFFCGLWILLLKFPIMRQEFSAFELDLLPREPTSFIRPEDANQILARIGRLKARQRSLLLITRIRQALLRLNQLGTTEKLDDLLRHRGDADAAAIESSYTAPKFIIWAIPVLGFVGTVLGISNGVQAFSTLIQNAADLEGLRQSLKGVTYGLGQAFETTMLALCMSLCLMLLLSYLQRREDHLLACMDDYCVENLLQKVRMPSESATQQDLAALVREMSKAIENWCAALRSVEPNGAGDGKSSLQGDSAVTAKQSMERH